MKFTVNRRAKPSFGHVGNEKIPILIMDDFMENLQESLLSSLDDLEFSDFTTYYPGIRAPLPEDYITAVASAMAPLIGRIYSIPSDLNTEFFPSYYSLVTSQPEELSMVQSVPHIDGADLHRYALIHYLNPEPHGGTAFYRHKPTGYERVKQEKEPSFWDSFDAFHNQHGEPEPGYINASTEHFEKIGEVPYAQNRLVLYPGNLLHSGSIIPQHDIDDNPVTGRLTANIFLNFIEK